MADQRVEIIPVDRIKVGRRLRRDLGNIQELSESIAKHGLLNPITVTKELRLIAGQRRIEAAKRLGWKSISARVVDSSSPIEAAEMEIEENTLRKSFTDDELGDGLLRLDRLRKGGIFKRFWTWLRRHLAAVFRHRGKSNR